DRLGAVQRQQLHGGYTLGHWATSSRVASLQCATCATRRANVAASPSQDWEQVGKISTFIVVHVLHGECHGVGRPDAAREAPSRQRPVAPAPRPVVPLPPSRAVRALQTEAKSPVWSSLVIRTSGRRVLVAMTATLFVASACDDPPSPKPVAALLMPTYPLGVTVSTVGVALDPDGYAVWVDDSLSQPVDENGALTFNVP